MREEDFDTALEQIARLCGLAGRREIQVEAFARSAFKLIKPMMDEVVENSRDYALRVLEEGRASMSLNPLFIRSLIPTQFVEVVPAQTREAPQEVSFAKTECPACHEPLFYAKEERLSPAPKGVPQPYVHCYACEHLVVFEEDATNHAIFSIVPASTVLENYGSGGDCEKVTCQTCGDVWIMPASMDYILCDKLHLKKDEATGKVSTTRCNTVIQRDKEHGQREVSDKRDY